MIMMMIIIKLVFAPSSYWNSLFFLLLHPLLLFMHVWYRGFFSKKGVVWKMWSWSTSTPKWTRSCCLHALTVWAQNLFDVSNPKMNNSSMVLIFHSGLVCRFGIDIPNSPQNLDPNLSNKNRQKMGRKRFSTPKKPNLSQTMCSIS